MTSTELAEKIVNDLAAAVQSGEWKSVKPLCVSALAGALEAIEKTAYDRGMKDGQSLSLIKDGLNDVLSTSEN